MEKINYLTTENKEPRIKYGAILFSSVNSVSSVVKMFFSSVYISGEKKIIFNTEVIEEIRKEMQRISL